MVENIFGCVTGKRVRKVSSVGVYPKVSLSDARKKREEAAQATEQATRLALQRLAQTFVRTNELIGQSGRSSISTMRY